MLIFLNLGLPWSWSSWCRTIVVGTAIHTELTSAVPAVSGTTETESEQACLTLEVGVAVLASGAEDVRR